MQRYVKLIRCGHDYINNHFKQEFNEVNNIISEMSNAIEDLLDDIENRISCGIPCDSCVYRGKIKLEESPCKQCRYRVCIMETMDSIDGSCRYIYDEGE